MDLTIRDLDLIPDLGSVSAVTRPSTCCHLLREVVGARGGGGGSLGLPPPVAELGLEFRPVYRCSVNQLKTGLGRCDL